MRESIPPPSAAWNRVKLDFESHFAQVCVCRNTLPVNVLVKSASQTLYIRSEITSCLWYHANQYNLSQRGDGHQRVATICLRDVRSVLNDRDGL